MSAQTASAPQHSTRTVKLVGPHQLPLAAYLLFFEEGFNFIYKGQPLQVHTVHLRSGAGSIKKMQVGEFIYLEQNPHSGSVWAHRAQDGDRILWVIHEPSGKYVGRVLNGKLERL